MTILILADAWDPHADKVCSLLASRGAQYARLNLDVDALKETMFTLAQTGGHISLPSGQLKISDVTAVWARRLNVVLSLQEEHEKASPSFQIWKNEWNRHLYWIFQELQGAYWLNPLVDGALADNKRRQMSVAKVVGLAVPATIASNDKRALIEFAAEHGPVAAKFLSQSVVEADGKFLGLYVHRLTVDDLAGFGGSSEQPLVLQSYVDKDFEVRYTVVGEEHLVCRIDSQLSERAATDWRRYDLGNTPHLAIIPPPEVARCVRGLMAALKIDYGALDFIVDKQGKWWFLEVNSNGQWLWIEELTGLAISERISSLLCDKSGAIR